MARPNTVGMAAALQLLQAGKFALMGGDNHLAADLMRNAVLAAEGDHGGGAGDAQLRLQRAGAVIEAGVDNAAVVAALVGGEAGFLFQDGEAQGGEAARDFQGGSESDDSTADNDEVETVLRHGSEQW